MHTIYNLVIILYGILLKIASLFHPKAKQWVEGRKKWFSQLPIIEQNRQVVWFHCASLGEFDQALPIINLMKEKDAHLFVLVTFFSPSGFLHYHKRQHKADYVCYLPLDTPSNATKFIRHFHPQKVFFVKYEFWANYIFELKKTTAPLYLVSALFRKEQRFFKRKGNFFQSILFQFDHFFVQNKLSADLLKSIGITNYTITGDTRFDRVLENKKNLQSNPILEAFLEHQPTFILGSSWIEDEEVVIPLMNNQTISTKVIIAPHDISENHIEKIAELLSVPFIRYTELTNGKKSSGEQVLILDTIGALANAYSYGNLAYIGGGFSGSLHNILEPAVFGLPVIFGPKHSKFPEGEAFISNGIGFSIKNSEELTQLLQQIHLQLDEIKDKTIQFVENQAGASQKIIDFFKF